MGNQIKTYPSNTAVNVVTVTVLKVARTRIDRLSIRRCCRRGRRHYYLQQHPKLLTSATRSSNSISDQLIDI